MQVSVTLLCKSTQTPNFDRIERRAARQAEKIARREEAEISVAKRAAFKAPKYSKAQLLSVTPFKFNADAAEFKPCGMMFRFVV
jgi:hypothetical protein